MEDLLHRLEKQIRDLVDQHQQLKHNNHHLQQGKYVLSREKEALVTRQKKAIAQIETLVSRLKAIETIS
jgi:uncharacterized protein (TIGR02449 family)